MNESDVVQPFDNLEHLESWPSKYVHGSLHFKPNIFEVWSLEAVCTRNQLFLRTFSVLSLSMFV